MVALFLAMAVVSPLSLSVCAAAEVPPEVRRAEPPSSPCAPPTVPWDLLWSGGLFLGYISMDLKRHLRRRGHESAGRDRAFADLISLAPTRRSPPAPPPHPAPPTNR